MNETPQAARERLMGGWRQRVADQLDEMCRVAVTCPRSWTPEKGATTVITVAEALLRAGALPVLISDDPEDPLRNLDEMQALVLPGGQDVDPQLYGADDLSTHEGGLHPEFDRFEVGLAKRALETGLPMLGSCRGCHVMNVAAGGTLTQNLRQGSLLQSIVGESTLVTPLDHVGQKLGQQAISVVTESRLGELVGVQAIVNSVHHQCVDRLGEVFVAVAHAEDGVVEAFQHRERPHQSAYQFHPEMLAVDQPIFQRLFDLLVKDARSV